MRIIRASIYSCLLYSYSKWRQYVRYVHCLVSEPPDMYRTYKCCGTVLIYCGSVPVPTLEKFWFQFRLRFRLRFRFRFQFRIQTYLAQFFNNNKNFTKSSLFDDRAALFLRKVASNFWFFTIVLYLCWIRVQIRFWNRTVPAALKQKVVVSAVPVPQRWYIGLNDFNKAR